MWPQALQMTRDECRGILRRLELESYSHVISVFRAQGGLSDNKAKLLEELRVIFHISQERHRAEARRVANDEQLSTIAEAISGPNTWQEWSREGRRSFPMLPRVAPQTALALIANNVAAEAAAENFKLSYPADTAAAVAEEHAAYASARDASAAWEQEQRIVTSDPFKMPDIPAAPKKNLKRNLSDTSSVSSKKRMVHETSPIKHQQQPTQKQYQHITANSPGAGAAPAATSPSSNIRKLYHNHSKMQQQRHLHQPQAPKQKVGKKSAAAASGVAGGTGKRQATPAKSGRRAQQKMQEQLKQQQILQQQAQQQQLSGISDMQFMGDAFDGDLQQQQQALPYALPQIAASKKDITKNLTKLQIPAGSTRITTLEHALATSPTGMGQHGGKIVDKQLISTPVQKIILEDRQAPQSQSSTTPSTPLQVQSVASSSLSSTPQIMTLPQINAAATKLRAVNTTMLPPGTKLATTKKLGTTATVVTVDHNNSSLVGTAVTSQPQVFNIIEGTTITTNAAQSPPGVPSHTPPAIIQLHSSSSGDTSSSSPQQPAQGKVLTTKLLPIVLSGTGTASSNTSSANITKIETLNNGATIMATGSGVSSVGATIIKNLPSTMLLPNQGTGSTNTLFSTLGSGATVFRKPPNIIKTGFIGMGAGSVIGSGTAATKISSNFSANASNSGGPQIISNVKLTPATITPSTGSSGATSTQQHFLQQQLKPTGIRTSVQICQSPNGKVFIQSANMDPSKKLGLGHKLIGNTILGTASASGGLSSSTPQRIAIQKVQIIPAPAGNVPQQQKPTTLTLSGGSKSNMNMIFLPTSGVRTSVTGTVTLAKGSITTTSGGNIISKSTQQQHQSDAGKPNLVVIGAAPVPATQQQQLQKSASTSAYIDNNNKMTTQLLDATQMITEDTPVDILNMPIIVDSDGCDMSATDCGGSNTGNNIGDTVTVLSSALVETAAQQQQQSTVILGATDWEMELDQATAKARTQRRRSSSNNISNASAAVSSAFGKRKAQQPPQESAAIYIDDSFDDVIVEEEDEENDDSMQQLEEQHLKANANTVDVLHEEIVHPSGNTITTTTTNNNTNNDIILLDSVNKSKAHLNEDAASSFEVIDEEPQKQQQQTESGATEGKGKRTLQQTTIFSAATTENEADAGFDETIVTEIDENTAIEYIEEEDQSESTEPCLDDNRKEDMLADDAATAINDEYIANIKVTAGATHDDNVEADEASEDFVLQDSQAKHDTEAPAIAATKELLSNTDVVVVGNEMENAAILSTFTTATSSASSMHEQP